MKWIHIDELARYVQHMASFISELVFADVLYKSCTQNNCKLNRLHLVSDVNKARRVVVVLEVGLDNKGSCTD